MLLSAESLFRVVENISTPISLTAFIVALVYLYLRNRTNVNIKKLHRSNPSNVNHVLLAVSELYQIDTDRLSEEQKYNYIIKVLENKQKWQTKVLLFSSFIAMLLFILILAPQSGRDEVSQAKKEVKPVQTVTPPQPMANNDSLKKKVDTTTTPTEESVARNWEQDPYSNNGKNKDSHNDKEVTNVLPTTPLNWLTLDDVQTKMKHFPKKVWINMNAPWSGFCVRMESTTYRNPFVVQYLQQNFYAVKFNAEQRDAITFLDKTYNYNSDKHANELAIELMKGQLSYPSAVVLDENFENPEVISGFLSVEKIETLLKFINERKYAGQSFEDFEKHYKPTWRN